MTISEKKLDDLKEFFDLDFDQAVSQNKRVTVRYIRDDIKVYLKITRLLIANKSYPVTLHDISSRGVLVSCDKKLQVNNKHSLVLEFEDGKQYAIQSKILRRTKAAQYYYGIKFSSINHDLGEHLLVTQKDLIFK